MIGFVRRLFKREKAKAEELEKQSNEPLKRLSKVELRTRFELANFLNYDGDDQMPPDEMCNQAF